MTFEIQNAAKRVRASREKVQKSHQKLGDAIAASAKWWKDSGAEAFKSGQAVVNTQTQQFVNYLTSLERDLNDLATKVKIAEDAKKAAKSGGGSF